MVSICNVQSVYMVVEQLNKPFDLVGIAFPESVDHIVIGFHFYERNPFSGYGSHHFVDQLVVFI